MQRTTKIDQIVRRRVRIEDGSEPVRLACELGGKLVFFLISDWPVILFDKREDSRVWTERIGEEDWTNLRFARYGIFRRRISSAAKISPTTTTRSTRADVFYGVTSTLTFAFSTMSAVHAQLQPELPNNSRSPSRLEHAKLVSLHESRRHSSRC